MIKNRLCTTPRVSRRVFTGAPLALALIAATAAGLAAATPRTHKPAAKAPPSSALPAEIRAGLTPAGYAQLLQATAHAQAYFRPNSIRRREYSETSSSFGGGSPKNKSCSVRFLSGDSINVSMDETTVTGLRSTPYVVDTTSHSHSEACSTGGSGSDVSAPRQQQVVIPGGGFTPGDKGAPDDLQISAELDPSKSVKHSISFHSRAIGGTCREISRWRPGEWKPGFAFNMYVLQCSITTTLAQITPGQSMTMQRTTYFSPELSYEFFCGVQQTSNTPTASMRTTTSNISARTEGKVIRVTCNSETRTSVAMPGLAPATAIAKGETEETITLL
jgi:hypothetical protein